jgi:hypothetical protein
VGARLPQQIALALGAAAASVAAGALAGAIPALRAHRGSWGQLALAATAAIAAALGARAGAPFPSLVLSLASLVLLAATAVGWLVARRTLAPTSAHAAFAALVGFAFGQWMPLAY